MDSEGCTLIWILPWLIIVYFFENALVRGVRVFVVLWFCGTPVAALIWICEQFGPCAIIWGRFTVECTLLNLHMKGNVPVLASRYSHTNSTMNCLKASEWQEKKWANIKIYITNAQRWRISCEKKNTDVLVNNFCGS